MPVVDIKPDDHLQAERDEVVVCVPLYGAHEHFARCLQSLLAHTPAEVKLLIADDRTPDPASRKLADELQKRGVLEHQILWLRQPRNQGFVGNVNAAFAVAAPADVVIVNSDVVVASGWLARMRAVASSHTAVATVTALTNHGTLVSVPERNVPLPALPQDITLEAAAELVSTHSRQVRPRLPVAIGHCLWVRRAALELIGDFDLAFAPGYGEEVDFAQRCLRYGLQHLVADDVLVAHHGGGSFGEERSTLQLEHEAIINARYPYYRNTVLQSAADASGPLARSLSLASRALRGLRVTIDGRALGPFLTGTQVHTLELIAALARTGQARVRVIVPDRAGDYVQPALGDLDAVELIPASRVDELVPDDLAHRPWQLDTLDDLVLLRRLGHRVLLTQQDLIAYLNPSYFPSGEAWEAYRRLTAEAMALSAMTLFFSEHARADAIAEELTSPHRSRVVYIGTDHRVSVQRPEPQRPPQMPEDPGPFLLCLGTDFRHKNRQFALRLLAALRERHHWSGRLVLAGPHVSYGSSSADEASLLALNPELGEAIVDLAAVSEPEKGWLLAQCAAVLYPTTYEGFGLVPFEAAEAGKPCLFAAQTSLAEVLDPGTARLVAWDPAASADAVIEILTDPHAAQGLVDEIRGAAKRFSWDQTGAGLLGAYEQALTSPARPSERLTDDPLVAEARYWALRDSIGGTGMSLVDPVEGLLDLEAQRGLAALIRRPGARQLLLRPLKLAGRLGSTSRAERLREQAGGEDVELPPGVDPPV